MVQGDYAPLAAGRAARALELAERYPASRQALEFYAAISDFQARLAARVRDRESLAEALAELNDLVGRIGPEALRNARPGRLEDYLNHPDPGEFHWRVLLEVWTSQSEIRAPGAAPNLCPRCGHPPQAGALRKMADGAALTLVCSLCCREWPFPRTACPSCGESGQEKIAFYSAPGFEHIQTQACESCRTYLHVVDCGREPRAVPEADAIAALPLDIWAMEQGYGKLYPSLIGL
jgi:formate dehydrogenase maturation protein FdhE